MFRSRAGGPVSRPKTIATADAATYAGAMSRSALRISITVGLLIVGVVVGLIFQNVWLGVLLAAIVWLGWFLGYESRRGNNAGVNDEDHGIEL